MLAAEKNKGSYLSLKNARINAVISVYTITVCAQFITKNGAHVIVAE